jgi:hypothetical protein
LSAGPFVHGHTLYHKVNRRQLFFSRFHRAERFMKTRGRIGEWQRFRRWCSCHWTQPRFPCQQTNANVSREE